MPAARADAGTTIDAKRTAMAHLPADGSPHVGVGRGSRVAMSRKCEAGDGRAMRQVKRQEMPHLLHQTARRALPLCVALLTTGCAWLMPTRGTLGPTTVPAERIAALVNLLEEEWRRWGSAIVRIDGATAAGGSCLMLPDGRCAAVDDGCGQEQTAALCPVVTAYWRAVTLIPLHGCEADTLDVCETTRPDDAPVARGLPWSAVFVSAMMKKAGFARTEFAFSPRHAEYIADARDGFASAFEVVPTPSVVAPGDLVCTGRGRNRLLPADVADIRSGDTMHCDVIVSVDLVTRQADAIGGNVQQTVARIVVPLDDEGRVLFDEGAARRWALVMRIRRADDAVTATVR